VESKKVCTKCGEEKPLLEFVTDKRNRSGVGSWCKACMYQNSQRWRKNNPEKTLAYHREYGRQTSVKLYRRNWYLRKAHGIDHEAYSKMLLEQNNGCAICSGEANSKDGFFHVDHDHASGKIRALLCHFCNTGLGSFRDSQDCLSKAIEYLRKHNGI
jgi:hypothetical protein